MKVILNGTAINLWSTLRFKNESFSLLVDDAYKSKTGILRSNGMTHYLVIFVSFAHEKRHKQLAGKILMTKCGSVRANWESSTWTGNYCTSIDISIFWFLHSEWKIKFWIFDLKGHWTWVGSSFLQFAWHLLIISCKFSESKAELKKCFNANWWVC